MPTKTDHKFPCPVCTRPLEVRLTKKSKPYVTCDPCGVQLFIRGPEGIGEFRKLIERGSRKGLIDRMEEMERHYRLSCQECGCPFWIERSLVKTSSFDGSLKGFQCPDCGEIVSWERKP
jgi:transcription elongation factor Elf1